MDVLMDCDIQLNETVPGNALSDTLGKLILEELRCFRQEMKEEVRKLSMNVQNVLFSKADVINAMLSNCPLSKIVDNSPNISHVLTSTQNERTKQYEIQDEEDSLQEVKEEKCSDILDNLILDDSPDSDSFPLHSSSDTHSLKLLDSARVLQGADRNLKSTSNVVYKKDVNLRKKSTPVEVQVYQYNGTSDNSVCAPGSSSKAVLNVECNPRSLLDASSDGKGVKSENRNPSTTSKNEALRASGKPSIDSVKHTKLKYRPASSLVMQQHGTFPKTASTYKEWVKYNRIKHAGGYENHEILGIKVLTKKKFFCKYCQKHFLSKNDLLRHVRVHTGDRPFSCSVCTKAYTRNDHLKRHIRQKHPEIELSGDVKPAEDEQKLTEEEKSVEIEPVHQEFDTSQDNSSLIES